MPQIHTPVSPEGSRTNQIIKAIRSTTRSGIKHAITSEGDPEIGYIEQNRDEMEVLFTLRAYRYERGSMLLTSNLPFSKWEVVSKDIM